MSRDPSGEVMPPDPGPLVYALRHPLLTEAAVQFEAGVAQVEFRRMVERAMRRLDEDRRREVAELLFFAQLVGDTAAWVAEKFARLKMKVDDLSGSRVKRLESLEALAVGIHGKGALAAAKVPGPDYERPVARADEQRQQIEVVRLDAAWAALGT
jgi:hypothetical protein